MFYYKTFDFYAIISYDVGFLNYGVIPYGKKWSMDINSGAQSLIKLDGRSCVRLVEFSNPMPYIRHFRLAAMPARYSPAHTYCVADNP